MANKLCNLCEQVTASTEWTVEDVWPNWLRTASQPYSPSPLNDLPRRKLQICSACNGKMGAAFEDPASQVIKPLLDGSPRTLSVKDQQAVTAWATKTVALTSLFRLIRRDDSVGLAALGKDPDHVMAQDRAIVLSLLDGQRTPTDLGALVRIGLQTDAAPVRASPRPFDIPVPGTYEREWPLLVMSSGSLVLEAGIWGHRLETIIARVHDDDRLVHVSQAIAPAAWPPSPISPAEVQLLHSQWNERGVFESYDITKQDS